MSSRLRALSLWQPHADLMRFGIKVVETRPRSLSYEGDMVICSAKHWDDECARLLRLPEIESPLLKAYKTLSMRTMPFGCALCIVEMYGCVGTEDALVHGVEDQRPFGNFSAGRFALFTRKCRTLKTPVPILGRQGLFTLSVEESAAVRAQLP